MGDFMTQYLKIMKDLAEAADEDQRAEESKIKDAVDDLIDLYEDEDRTCYQLALLAIQITWWADPRIYNYQVEDYGEQVPALCQEMRAAEPNFKHDSPLGEVLEHLEREAGEALEYAGKLIERNHRRSRAGKWNDSFLHRDVPRPRVVPRSRRDILEQRQLMEERLGRRGTDGDIEGGDIDEDDPHECEDYDEMETDDFDGYEDEDEDEYDTSEAGGVDNAVVANPTHGSESDADDSSSTNDDYKMTLISNSGDVVAEISDLESSVYIKAFIQYWNDDPEAWRKHIDLWEQRNGIPGRSILHCLKREDGDELREMGELPFRMSMCADHSASN